ncbi:MAG: C40 family peptidase [bacterium]
MRADPWRKRMVPAGLGILILLAALFTGGCAGMRPHPTYSGERGKTEKRDEGKRPSSKKTAKTTGAKTRKAPVPTGGNDALDRQVNIWWGTPYAWGGNTRDRGVDCSGYVCAVYKTVYGINLPRTARTQYGKGRPIERNQLRRGDLVFFNTDGTGVSHVGIYLGGNRFTHASNSDGVTIDKLSSPYYSKRYVGARRIR